jgi:hypothetical protein
MTGDALVSIRLRSLSWDSRYVDAALFSDILVERSMAKHWIALTLNWGRMEYWLCTILEAIDPERADEWTIDFFSDSNRHENGTAARARQTAQSITSVTPP